MKNTSKAKIYLINAYSNYDANKFFITGSDRVALEFASQDSKNSIIIGPKTLSAIIPKEVQFIPSQEVFTKNILLDYVLRTLNTLKLLSKLDSGSIIVSTTDFFCDVIPGYWSRKKFSWYCFTYHLYPSFFVNFKLRDLFGKMLQDFSFLMFKKSYKIFTSNFECINYLKNNFKIKDIAKIPLGINISDYRISKTKTIDLVFLGRIKESKGIFELPEIVSLIRKEKPDLKVVVIGNGPQEEVEKIKKLNKEFNSNIEFLGSVPDKVVLETLSKSKILIQLDSENGFGLNIIEALASGCYIIGYDLPSYRDNFKNLKLFMSNQKDKKAVANQALKILNSKQEPLNQVSMLDRFDWKNIYKLVFNS